jgi:eukaryotic-like serine/threonine-protein kinase
VTLAAGSELGGFEIVRLLGAGGMGEVYLARDRRLNRHVALKVLPARVELDPHRLTRFEQEARAASALSHTNICHIYHLGDTADHRRYIVMEHVDGETLHERLLADRPALREALDIAIQIASALTAAHAAGIVHRDIKPENVMIRRDRVVKVLDFGVAKLLPPAMGLAPHRPTETVAGTEPGSIVGTIDYMAPEQARGLPVDARTDIWALGVVIYEMVVGRRPFGGATRTDVLAAILEREPEALAGDATDLHPELQRIVRKALRKDPEQRYQVTKDLLLDLEALREELGRTRRSGAFDSQAGRQGSGEPREAPHPPTDSVTPIRRTSRTRTAAVGVAVIAMVSLVVLSARLMRRSAAVERAPRVVPLTSLAGKEDWPTFAPDGEQVAFAWSGEKYDNTDIYVTLVGSQDVRRLTTDPAEDYAPSWSPDGRRIAFLRRDGNAARIHLISALGGPDAKVSEFPVGATVTPSLGAPHITWSPDGRYVVAGRDPRVASDTPAGIYVIPVEAGEPRAITRPKPPTFDFSPAFSPDGRHLAYASCDTPGAFLPLLLPGNCAIRVVDVDGALVPTGPPRTVTKQPVDPAGLAWSRDGKSILFVGSAMQSVYMWRLWLDGSRPPEPIQIAGPMAEHPATITSRDRLVFAQYDWDTHLYRFNGAHSPQRVAASSSFEGNPRFSPDGRRLAFTSGRSGDVAVWVAAADGSGARQITHGEWVWPGSPSWSPDGRVLAFDGAKPDSPVRIWTVDTEGGTPRQLTQGPGGQTAPNWSRDGRWIYFSNHGQSGRDIWRVPTAGGQPEQVTRGGSGFVSYETADGTGLVYQPRNGDAPLLLLPLAGAAPPRTLVDCVRSAAFATGGSEVFYVACGPGSNPSLHARDVATGRDRLLGNLEHFPPDVSHVNLAVSPDGETVLFLGLVRKGGDLMLIEDFR